MLNRNNTFCVDGIDKLLPSHTICVRIITYAFCEHIPLRNQFQSFAFHTKKYHAHSKQFFFHFLFLFSTMYPTSKLIHDPVHGLFSIDTHMVDIIDTPQFQRLRELKQLGACYFVFPGASHNRFEHSLGVMHIADTMVTGIRRRQPELGITEQDVFVVKMAGLCHDLGHGPFSHVFDNSFLPRVRPELHWKHEQASEMMLDYLIDDNCIDIEEDDSKIVKSLINPKGESFFKSDDKMFLYDIVSNSRNSVDVDKFDYLQRDCLNLGLKSSYDPSRLINHCRVIGNEICFSAKEAYNLYEMFHTRYSLFKQVYQHPVNKAIEMMICDAMVAADKVLGISECIDDKERYLNLTDSILSQIQVSKEPGLADAKSIIRRIQRRELYKVVNSALIPKEMEHLIKRFTSENVIAGGGDAVATSGLTANDLIIDIYKINYALKDKNPVDHAHFFEINDLNRKFVIGREKISNLIPDRFSECYVRAYLKTPDDAAKFEAAQMAFGSFLHHEFADKVKASPASKSNSTFKRLSRSSTTGQHNFYASAMKSFPLVASTAKKSLFLRSDLKTIPESVEMSETEKTPPYVYNLEPFEGLSQEMSSISPCSSHPIKKSV